MTRSGNETDTNKTFPSVYRRDRVGLDRPKADARCPRCSKPVGCDIEQVKVEHKVNFSDRS